MSIEKLTEDRELVVIALQALCRERVSAYNAAATVADTSNRNQPDRNDFGIEEVTEALRRIGAAPGGI